MTSLFFTLNEYISTSCIKSNLVKGVNLTIASLTIDKRRDIFDINPINKIESFTMTKNFKKIQNNAKIVIITKFSYYNKNKIFVI